VEINISGSHRSGRRDGTEAEAAKLGAILDQVDSGTILLPEFQRGYVWNRDQVRGLMRSLYREYPVGALLLWETDSADSTRGSYGGFLTPPDDGAVLDVLFWHKDGFSTACGHGTMAIGAWAVESGRVAADPSGVTGWGSTCRPVG
jgi:hypothetical protein